MKKATAGLIWCFALLLIGVMSGLLDYYTESNFGIAICIAAFFAMNYDLNRRG